MPHKNQPPHNAQLVATDIAQSEALMLGKSEAEVMSELKGTGRDRAAIKALAPHKTFEGNRPSNTIVYRQLDPETLGKIIALYEHKVFVQGTVWNINSFDQWGVELGKQLAKALLPAVEGAETAEKHDSSTQGLLVHFHQLRG